MLASALLLSDGAALAQTSPAPNVAHGLSNKEVAARLGSAPHRGEPLALDLCEARDRYERRRLAAEFHAGDGSGNLDGSITLLEVRSATEPAMRKQYKRKLRCCALCKPHKAGWDRRWKPKERELMRAAEREVRRLIRTEAS